MVRKVLNKHRRKYKKIIRFFQVTEDVSSTTTVNGPKKSPNNTPLPLARSFQYETFNVFDWDEYLAVSI